MHWRSLARYGSNCERAQTGGSLEPFWMRRDWERLCRNGGGTMASLVVKYGTLIALKSPIV